MSTLMYTILALIPALLYIGVIWITTPLRSINLKTSLLYLTTGMISVVLIISYIYLFPNSSDYQFRSNYDLSLLFFYYIQVSLVEEVFKLSAFLIGHRIRKTKRENDSPIGTMFYVGISALGFAFLENVNYAISYGGEILLERSILSMITHFVCGMIVGYWVSLSNIPASIENRSIMEAILWKKPRLRKFIYYTIGLFLAILYHGFFNHSIITSGVSSIAYIILFGGIISVYIGSKNLLERQKK